MTVITIGDNEWGGMPRGIHGVHQMLQRTGNTVPQGKQTIARGFSVVSI